MDHLIEWVGVDDIGPDTRWRDVLDGVTSVVHLAGIAHRLGTASKSAEAEMERVNVGGTKQLAESVACTPSVSRMVLVSSIGVYGDHPDTAVSERTPCTPDTHYGRTKLAAEHVVRGALEDSHVSACIVRPPLVYGPGNPGNMARLLRLLRSGLPLPLGMVDNKRSFVYVGNLAACLARCATHPAAADETFVIRDGEDVSTPELIRRLAELSGRRVTLFNFPQSGLRTVARLGDLATRLVGRSVGVDSYSIDRLLRSLTVDDLYMRETLAWKPPFSLNEGLRHTLAASPQQA